MSELQTFYAVQELIAQLKGIRADFRGRCLTQASFMVSLVFDQPHTWETRYKVLEAIRLYQNWMPSGALTWWVTEGGRPKDLSKAPVPMDTLESIAKDPKQGLAFAIGGGDGPVAKRFDEAQPYTITGVSSDMYTTGTGYVLMYFPIDWVLSQQGDWSFFSLANGLVERLQPLHATAGLGLVFPEEGGYFYRNIGESFQVYPLAKRYPGLEIQGGLHFRKYLEGIYTVNWLNYLREEMLERLGGRAKVKSQCEQAGLPTRDLGRCLLIQAGPGPAPGDTELDLDLAGYRAAMKILRPIRVEYEGNRYIAPPPDGIDDPEVSTHADMAYLTRFDDDPLPYPV